MGSGQWVVMVMKDLRYAICNVRYAMCVSVVLRFGLGEETVVFGEDGGVVQSFGELGEPCFDVVRVELFVMRD